jgi:hypothetical protein
MIGKHISTKLGLVILFSLSSAFILPGFVCFATGWNDFTLDIGDGYIVVRANSMDIGIAKANLSGILNPANYPNVGPLIGYITTPKHILTKNLGRKQRNLFEGDSFRLIDRSREFYFVISKGTDEVIGPMSKDEFAKRPEVPCLGKLDWRTPKNPNFLRPIIGTIMFLVLAIPFLASKFFFGFIT